jgi:tetratricopeptide (TPR) repeat protein
MVPQKIRLIARLAFAAMLVLILQLASAQAPKEQPKDPPKDSPKESPDEQKAKEHFFAGKLDEAVKSLQAAAKANPLIPPPKVVLAQWSLETKQGQQARLLIEQAAMEDPYHPQVLLTNASFALNEGRITDTILSCLEALKQAESQRWDADQRKLYMRQARLGLVAAYESGFRQDYASAKTHLVALLDADSKNAGLRQKLANANLFLTRYDDAYDDLKRAFADDMTLDPPELTMAQFWTGKADFVKADEWYDKALKAHEKSAKVQRGFAGYLLDRGRAEAGKKHLDAAQKIEPNAKETKALVGLYARYAKDYKTATQIFEDLVRQHPSYGIAQINLALVLTESGDADSRRRATELAASSVNQNQRSPDAWAVYAYCLFKAQRTGEAEKAAKMVITVGGQLSLDAAYYVAKILADRAENEQQAYNVIKAACDKKEWFLHRDEAAALLRDLEKKVPKK